MIINRKRIIISLLALLLAFGGFLLWQAIGIGDYIQDKLQIVGFVVKAPEFFTPDIPGLQPAARFVVIGIPEKTSPLQWTITVSSQGNSRIKNLSGKIIPENGIVWDGRDEKGVLVQAATPCTATLNLSLPGQKTMQVKAAYQLGYALSQQVGRTSISNSPLEFSFKRTDDGLSFFLNDDMYQSLQPIAKLMSKSPEFPLSVWAGKDRSMRNQDRANTEALQRAAAIRRGLIHFGISPERIRLDVIPITPGHYKSYDIELAIDKPLLTVLSADNGGY